MDKLTELISSEIKKQYKSVRRFAVHMDIPQTTLFSILRNGVSGTAYETVIRMCRELGIDIVNFQSPIKLDDDAVEMIRKYNLLDSIGTHTVNAVLNAEYERCKK